MNQEINNQYKIIFRNKVSKFDGFPSKINKNVATISVTLSTFLYEWRSSIDDINEDLWPSLNNSELMDNIQSETVGVYIVDGVAKMYSLNTSSSPLHPDLTLSLADLTEIVRNWKEFLLTPPLNGTKIKLSLIDRFKKIFNK